MKRFPYDARPAVALSVPRTAVLSLTLCVVLCAAAWIAAGTESTAILFPELGRYHRPVTTRSTEAQQFFDQGLTFLYGFNHAEAIRSFRQATVLDPNCAMAWWGIAYANGPHINNPTMAESAARDADDALRRALALADSASPVERDLIRALTKRYTLPMPTDRTALNKAYADAMSAVWRDHPTDADIGALYVESMMNMRPWDLWTGTGQPQPGTPEIVATLEKVLALRPDHPGALHFYIHAVEASPTPEKAAAAANRLRYLVPGSGHLVHMPSHIDIRLGHYDEAVQANQRAIEADLRYVNQVGRKGFYNMYRAHNYHFLAYAAMFEGRRALALRAAQDIVAELTPAIVRENPDVLEAFQAVPIHARVRFGLWEELLAEPKPPADMPLLTAFWHYGRTVALASLGRRDEAVTEYTLLERACAAVPESRLIGNNPARIVLDLAKPMAKGELEYRRGNVDQAFELLRDAVRRDDALRYDEPWGWMQPVRHALGALLLEQGQVAAAETVYREDLRLHPDNGWALHGLAECLHRQGRTTEMADVSNRLQKSWARSDITLRASCFCRRGSRTEAD